MLRRILAAAIALTLILVPWAGPAAGQPSDWGITNGHFYTQAGPGDGTGYAITDDDGVPFWTTFRELGGVDAVGFPISRRFVLDGFTVQAMQRVVFQWRPEERRVDFLNVLDVLSRAGYDGWLLDHRQVPGRVVLDEQGKSWEDIVAGRLSFLEERPAINAKYFSVRGDPIAFNGLPTSRVVDMGNHYALRTQRTVLQEWKEDVPWARMGEVTLALGGAMAREAGLLPGEALRSEDPPPAVQAAPALGGGSLFDTQQVVSLYGLPGAPVLGALGEQGLAATVARAKDMASRVDAQNGAMGALPAFHIIYALAHPSPVPGHLDSATVEAYIAAAEQNGILVFLDLQIAGSPLQRELSLVLPYLHHPNVHLAIDPEFVTLTPGVNIGSLDATQINAAQAQISAYLEEQGIAGRKILIVHQFDESMITRKGLIEDYPRVDLVIDADGVGGKAAKLADYFSYAEHPTREYLGFKVFLLYDVPPMSIAEVLALDPQPNVMIFQ